MLTTDRIGRTDGRVVGGYERRQRCWWWQWMQMPTMAIKPLSTFSAYAAFCPEKVLNSYIYIAASMHWTEYECLRVDAWWKMVQKKNFPFFLKNSKSTQTIGETKSLLLHHSLCSYLMDRATGAHAYFYTHSVPFPFSPRPLTISMDVCVCAHHQII